jgi:hypothetical protein
LRFGGRSTHLGLHAQIGRLERSILRLKTISPHRRDGAGAMRRLSPNRGLQIGARTRRLDRARAAPAALGSISKQRDRYLRRLLIVGATTVICDDPDKHHEAACQKPVKKVAGALAKNLQGASARGVRITARKWEWPARQANCGGDDGVMGSSRAVDLENPGRFTCGRARRFDWDGRSYSGRRRSNLGCIGQSALDCC